MAVNISDLSMCVEVDLAFYPAQHQHSKQWNNSVIEVKVNIPMTNKTVIALETWICSAQTGLCRLNQQGWQGAGLLATAHPATWARLIYGRLTPSLIKRMCTPKSPCFRPSKLFPLQGISAFGLGEQDCPCFFWARLWQVDHHNIISYRSCWCGFQVTWPPPPTWLLAGSLGLSETFLVSVRLGLIGFWPKRDFLLLLGGLIGGSA